MSGIAREMADRMIAAGQATPGRYRTSFDAEAFKSVSLKMLEESGAHLLLYTLVADTIVKDGAVRGVIVENKSGRAGDPGRQRCRCYRRCRRGCTRRGSYREGTRKGWTHAPHQSLLQDGQHPS